MTDLRIKYRPESISDVWGNDGVKLIWDGFKRKSCFPKATVLHGLHGTAKTTLGRIFAKDITANNTPMGNGLFPNIYEIDAAQYDTLTWRYIQSFDLYAREPIAIFIDETQRLMERVQDAFLKIIEDSPHLYFIFATTEIERIDDGILSRSTKFSLRNPASFILYAELMKIAQKENIVITEEALKYLIEVSRFNPRECLGNLNTMLGQEGVIDARVIKILLENSIGY